MSKARTIAVGGSVTANSKFSGARELLATARQDRPHTRLRRQHGAASAGGITGPTLPLICRPT